jgi:membrane protein implicated in regulation of membrane protease activity
MALLRYTLLRLALLGVVAGVLYLLGLRDFWLLLLAFLISGGISLFLLSSARDEVSRAIATRNDTIRRRMAEPEPEQAPEQAPSAQDES